MSGNHWTSISFDHPDNVPTRYDFCWTEKSCSDLLLRLIFLGNRKSELICCQLHNRRSKLNEKLDSKRHILETLGVSFSGGSEYNLLEALNGVGIFGPQRLNLGWPCMQGKGSNQCCSIMGPSDCQKITQIIGN